MEALDAARAVSVPAIPRSALFAAIVWLALTVSIAGAQTPPSPQDGQPSAVQTDSDPRRPVFVSIRPEFYKVSDDMKQRALIVRYDAAAVPKLRLFRGAPGVIMRFEVPLVGADVGDEHRGGVGDAYAQALVVPYAKKGFAWALGTGVVVPTATNDRLGSGKLMLAPVLAPVWRRPRGMFLVKVQNFTSVAGASSRPHVNHLLITPLFVQGVGAGWWVLADSETKTNWTREGRTGVKSGLQVGRRLAPNVAFWIKPEAWWGPNRDGAWNLKFGLVWYQRPGAANRK